MILALCAGLGLFVLASFAHLMIWRIRRPLAYPIWLPAIFVGMPLLILLAAAIVLAVYPDLPFFGSCIAEAVRYPWSLVAGFALHLALSACYTCGYAGIVEYSPSAEILQAVEKHMPRGIEPERLEVASLSEQALTGKRFHHLLASKMIHADGEQLMLTPAGQRVVNFWKRYRAFFGVILSE